MKQYTRKPTATVSAIQMNFDVYMSYEKWGGKQIAKRGDWIVDNAGDVYTVNRESFAATYSQTSPGVFFKTGTVWAEIAMVAGHIATKEGMSAYKAGDYLVYNNPDCTDGYCVGAEKFLSMYAEVAA